MKMKTLHGILRSDPEKLHRFLLTALVTAGCFVALTHPAFAQTTMATTICNVVGIFYSTTARALAVLAVAMGGIGAILGKTSWGAAFTIGVGICIMAGAANIATALVGSSC